MACFRGAFLEKTVWRYAPNKVAAEKDLDSNRVLNQLADILLRVWSMGSTE